MAKKYKMMIITDYAAPYEGNFIESLKKLNEKIVEQKNDVIYFFSPKAKDKNCVKGLQNLGYKVYFGSENAVVNIKLMKKVIKQEGISVLYTHFCSLKNQVQIKLIKMLNPKIKLICHFHNHYNAEGKFPRKQLAYISYNGDLNIGCSESVMDSIPYTKKKKVYVDNCIFFERLDKYRDIKIDETGKKFVILMFGFDYYRKGVDIAIKAIKDLDINDNIVLAISLSKNKEKNEKIICEEFGYIPKFVKFLDPIDDIATYYRNSNLFLSAAREEGLCYSIVEAAYCEKKIVSSIIPGSVQNIPGEVLFENENYVELSRIIKQLYYDNKTKKEEQAKKFVENNFSIDKWVNGVIKNIEKIV